MIFKKDDATWIERKKERKIGRHLRTPIPRGAKFVISIHARKKTMLRMASQRSNGRFKACGVRGCRSQNFAVADKNSINREGMLW